MNKKIERYRRRIDRIDRRVAALLSRRFHQVLLIGRVKSSEKIDVTDTARETEVLDRVGSVASGKSTAKYVLSVYRSIIDESSRIQREGGEWTEQ